MQEYGDAFSGAAFHCYAGSVSAQDSFHNAAPSKVREPLNAIAEVIYLFFSGHLFYGM